MSKRDPLINNKHEAGIGANPRSANAFKPIKLKRCPTKTEEDMPKGPTWCEIFSNPWDYPTLWFYLLGFFCGGAAIILYYDFGITDADAYIAGFLCLLGLYAAYEFRLLAKLRVQLMKLNKAEEELEAQAHKLHNELDTLQRQVSLFGHGVESFDVNTDRVLEENAELEETVLALTNTVEGTNTRNKELKEAASRLKGFHISLTESVLEMQERADLLEKEIASMTELRDNMENHENFKAESIQNLRSTLGSFADTLRQQVQDKELAYLSELAAVFERKFDEEDGLNRAEFQGFLKALPRRYRMKSMTFTFEELRGENDFIDFEQIQTLIRVLVGDEDPPENKQNGESKEL